MKKSSKALLLSAVVFPGAGHIYLKQFTMGILLSGGTASALYFLVARAVNSALAIAEKIQTNEVALDIYSIASMVSEQHLDAEGDSWSIAAIALMAIWITGIVDLYRQRNTAE